MKIIDNLYKYMGLLNEKGIPSAHKLSSFAAIMFIAYCHYKYVTSANATTVIIIDWLVALLLLGRITFSEILKLKNGNTDKSTESEK